jgi:hypothetical protein
MLEKLPGCARVLGNKESIEDENCDPTASASTPATVALRNFRLEIISNVQLFAVIRFMLLIQIASCEKHIHSSQILVVGARH